MANKRHPKKRLGTRKFRKGAIANGTMFVVIFLVIVGSAAFMFVGGSAPSTVLREAPGDPVAIDPAITEASKDNLQLYTFTGVTITPTPPPPLPAKTINSCADQNVNDEPDIFYASDPAPGGTVAVNGQLRVWVDDGNGGSVAPGEVIDKNTGAIIQPGDRTKGDGRGKNYYLWEPAIYLTPISSPNQPGPYSGDAENGGTAHFPVIIKGGVSEGDSDKAVQLPPIDPPVNILGGKDDHGGTIAEFIWDVNKLGVPPGLYRAQIVVHDGDGDLAISCNTLQIQ